MLAEVVQRVIDPLFLFCAREFLVTAKEVEWTVEFDTAAQGCDLQSAFAVILEYALRRQVPSAHFGCHGLAGGSAPH
jgi:hypothetical protein